MTKLSAERQSRLKQSLSKMTPEDLAFIYDQLAPRITQIREQARDRALKHFRQRRRMMSRYPTQGDPI